jgi:hypothetical protein
MSSDIVPIWLRRRLGGDNLERFIGDAIQQQPTPCEDFGDEFEYADNIISWACDDFLNENDGLLLGDKYDDIYNIVYDYVKDMYGPELLEDYVTTCADYED